MTDGPNKRIVNSRRLLEPKMTANAALKSRRRFLRFSLRTLLICMIVVGFGLGWLGWKVHQARKQRQVVVWVQEMGGRVLYDFQFDKDRDLNLSADPSLPRWLLDLTSIDFWHDVTGVELTRVNALELAPLLRLPRLQGLLLGASEVSNVTPLSQMKNLRMLDLYGWPRSDLSFLSTLTNLERLSFDDTPVSDLTPIANLTNLTELSLKGTTVSDLSPLAGMKELKWLSLDDTEVSNLEPLTKLPKLQAVWLDGTPIDDIAPLGQIYSLESVGLRKTLVTDLAPLAGLRADIYLDEDQQVTVPAESELWIVRE